MFFSFEVPHWLLGLLFGLLPLFMTIAVSSVHCTYSDPSSKHRPEDHLALTPLGAGMFVLCTAAHAMLLMHIGYWFGVMPLILQFIYGVACLKDAHARSKSPDEEEQHACAHDYDGP